MRRQYRTKNTTRGTGHPKCIQDDNEVHNQGRQSNLHRTRLRPSKSKGSNKAMHRNNSETERSKIYTDENVQVQQDGLSN